VKSDAAGSERWISSACTWYRRSADRSVGHHHHLQIVGVPMLDTIVIGFSLPICPTGIVRVYRVPCALTPPKVCVPGLPSSDFLRPSVLLARTHLAFDGVFHRAFPRAFHSVPPIFRPFSIRHANITRTGHRSLITTNDSDVRPWSSTRSHEASLLAKRPWLSRKRFVSVSAKCGSIREVVWSQKRRQR